MKNIIKLYTLLFSINLFMFLTIFLWADALWMQVFLIPANILLFSAYMGIPKLTQKILRAQRIELGEKKRILETAAKQSARLRVREYTLYKIRSDIPFSFTLGGYRGHLFLSQKLLDVLDEEEIACVLTHEMVHILRKDHLVHNAVCGTYLFLHILIRIPEILVRFLYNPDAFIKWKMSIGSSETWGDVARKVCFEFCYQVIYKLLYPENTEQIIDRFANSYLSRKEKMTVALLKINKMISANQFIPTPLSLFTLFFIVPPEQNPYVSTIPESRKNSALCVRIRNLHKSTIGS